MKKDIRKIFIKEIYSKPPEENYQSNKIILSRIDEIWSIDLADMVDYKTSNNKGFRYIYIIIVIFSKYLWAIPLINKNSQTITNEFSNILTTSKQSAGKKGSDRGTQFYNGIFQNFLKTKNIQQYSRFTDKGSSIAERVIRTIRNLLKKPIFSEENANWISEPPSVIKQNNNTIHSSTKRTSIQASRKSNEKLVYSNLLDRRVKQKPKFNLGQIVRATDIKRVFSKGDSSNFSYKLYTITEVIHDNTPSYQNNYLPERYNENLLLPIKLTLEKKTIKL